jgi:hypothetical protein
MIPKSNPKTRRIGICNARMAREDRHAAKSWYAPPTTTTSLPRGALKEPTYIGEQKSATFQGDWIPGIWL